MEVQECRYNSKHMIVPTFRSALQLYHLSFQGLAGFQELTSLLPSPHQLHADLQQMPEVQRRSRGKTARRGIASKTISVAVRSTA